MAVKRNQMAQALAKPQGASVQRITQVPQIATTSQYSAPNAQLEFGQGLINKAISGQSFDPRGGIGVAAAQIATAGIGAWAQNRARKDIAEKEVNRQTQLSSLLTSKGYTPESANAIASMTTPESGASLIGAFVNQDMAKNDPASQLSLQKTQAEIAKLNAETNKANKEARTAGTPSAPAGYSYNPDGSLKAIQGGPADQTNKPLSQEAAKTLTLAEGGSNIINNINKQFTKVDPKTKESSFDSDKFNKISAASKLSNIFIGTEPQLFKTRTKDLSDTIGRMRSGGAITTDEQENTFRELIPKFGDTPETVKYKLNQLDEGFKNISESIKPSAKSQNLQQPTGGQTSMPPQSGFKILNVRDK